ncbi:MAG: class I poly(R)-hydroxyalkanoic acid synthase, partial [Rhodobacterales bacterium]|nr:class I poly(R)-hydroxyalkanoic acid synthase [Rhodobacterales bacterium]MDX5499536.1 class I poly(R)-hydroxyalkanoic acid synthase [Rhodobacterales bacterium]
MATDECVPAALSEKMQTNLQRIEQLSQRLIAALARKSSSDPALDGPDPELYMQTAAAWMHDTMKNPAKVVEQQVAWWGKTLKHYVEAQHVLTRGKLAAPPDPGPKDRRFANPLWDTHPYFNFLKQQYLTNAQALKDAVAAIETLDPNDRHRVEYFTRQITDMMSPTNFLGTNPDALEKAVATEGESLVRGLENLVRDIEAN